MRFVCDHDVDAAVATTLRRLGHDAWTAANAGLSAASDDELNVVGKHVCKHVWLRCSEMDAAELVEDRISELDAALNIHKDVWVRLSSDGLALSFAWK